MTKIVKFSATGLQDRGSIGEKDPRPPADIILFPGVFYCRRDGGKHAPLVRVRDWIDLIPRA